MNPRLVAINGLLKGTTFTLTADEVSIGRESANFVSLNHRSISRRHCLIKRLGDEFTICDLESYNGTFVNGIPIKEQTLAHADQIRVGSFALLFLVDEGEDPDIGSLVLLDDSRVVTQSSKQMRPEALVHQTEQVWLQPQQDQRSARDLGALLKICSRINLLRHTQDIDREILDAIFEVVPANRGAILLTLGQKDFSSLYGRDRQDQNKTIHVSRTVVDRVLTEGVAILNNDIQGSESLRVADSLLAAQITSLMCMPLMVLEKIVGVIYLDTSDPIVQFDEGHLQLLASIAGVAAVHLENAHQMEWLESENDRLRSSLAIEHNMIGESAPMREVYHFIERVAPATTAVLVCGESGTGKELAAHALHTNSPRAAKPFVVINCAALAETLLESELFGHEKGAFTGAIARKQGKLQVAQGGSVLLDEIGELAAPLQAKLLRFLQDHKIEPLGSTRSIELDVRVIAATNRNLEEAITRGDFRADLYHRLNVVTVTMPPLRDRPDDIPLLASYFTAKYAKECKRNVTGISPEARALLQSYQWPGNVRELQNVIERAVLLAKGNRIEPVDLPFDNGSLPEGSQAGTGWDVPPNMTLEDIERLVIEKTLQRTGGNKQAAANLLGIYRPRLYSKIRKYNIDVAALVSA